VTNTQGNVAEATVNFTVLKATATFDALPIGQTLTYNTTAQALATAGTFNGGTPVYSLERVHTNIT
jgi:hypothetical protein